MVIMFGDFPKKTGNHTENLRGRALRRADDEPEDDTEAEDA